MQQKLKSKPKQRDIMTRTKYVLDTSALITDPNVFKSFKESDICFPITVLEELDKLKKQPGEVGKNARVSIRMLEELCNLGDINAGVKLDNGIMVNIDIGDYKTAGDALYGDTRILACALHLQKETINKVVLVSNDINLRVRARAMGLDAQGYQKEGAKVSDLYQGISYVSDAVAGQDLLTLGSIFGETYGHKFMPNECLIFQNEAGEELARGKQLENGNIKLIKKIYPWSLSPRNKEQEFAIDLLMDKDIPLVSLVGMAGTGKTLCALAAALELVLEKRVYNKVVIYRPIQPVGADIGYIPGTESEKLEPWFRAIMDNFEVLFSSKGGSNWRLSFEAAKHKEKIQMEAITYIRGRSIPNALMIIDECQNISREEMKTILTRVGDGTKIVLLGDVEQIDSRHLDATNNGLSMVIEKFKSSALSGHITFTQGERSELASYAASIL